LRHHPTSPLFPYTTLFRSLEIHAGPVVQGIRIIEVDDVAAEADHLDAVFALGELENGRALHVRPLRFSSAEDRRDPYRGVELLRDRKSTRLNSSHVSISYA